MEIEKLYHLSVKVKGKTMWYQVRTMYFIEGSEIVKISVERSEEPINLLGAPLVESRPSVFTTPSAEGHPGQVSDSVP